MSPFIGQFIEYSQLYNEKIPSLEEISQYFSKINTSQLLQLLCKMNIAIWKMEGNTRNIIKLQNNFISLLFPESERKLLINLLNRNLKQKIHTVPFHRHQLLLAIKISLLNVNSKGETLEDKTNLGKYLLAINEYIQRKDFSIALGIEVLEAELVRQQFSSMYYFSHYGRHVNEVGRALITWLELPKSQRFKDLLGKDSINLEIEKEFKEETGISVDEFISLCSMYFVHINYFDVNTDNPIEFMFTKDFWSKTKLSKYKQNKINKLLTEDINKFQKNYFTAISEKLKGKDIYESNFLPLMDKPILNLNSDYSIAADPQFLQEKISTGVYWILLNKFIREKNEKKQRDLSKYYGLLHQEYVHILLNNLCDEVIEIEKIKNNKTCDFIGIIKKQENTFLIFVEAKKIALHLPVLLSGEKDLTLSDLNKIFGDDGFGQIYSTIKLFEEGKIKEAEGISIEKIKYIFPLLIIDRFIVEESFNRNFYERNFLNKIVTKYQTVLKKARPIFMSSQEIEYIEAAKQNNHELDLIDFLLDRNSELNERFYKYQNNLPSGLSVSNIGEIVKKLYPIWENLYLKGFSKHINGRLKKVFLRYMNKTKKILFKKN